MQKFVGVIDSGVGGLTVMKDLQYRNKCNFRYIADHSFCPYGTKTDEVIFNRAKRIISYLAQNGAMAIVLACNTLSVFADELRKLYSLPIYDVIAPTCKAVTEITANNRVALLATDATVRNNAYGKVLSQYGITVVNFPCSRFVPFVEHNAVSSLSCMQAVEDCLNTLPQARVDTVILGCTHFPLLKKQISYFCKGASIVECSCGNLTFDSCPNPSTEFLTTGNAEFALNASKWYGKADFKHITI